MDSLTLTIKNKRSTLQKFSIWPALAPKEYRVYPVGHPVDMFADLQFKSIHHATSFVDRWEAAIEIAAVINQLSEEQQ